MRKPIGFLSCVALTAAFIGVTLQPSNAHEEGSFEVVQSMPMPHPGTSGSTDNMGINGAEPYRGDATATTTGSSTTGNPAVGTNSDASRSGAHPDGAHPDNATDMQNRTGTRNVGSGSNAGLSGAR